MKLSTKLSVALAAFVLCSHVAAEDLDRLGSEDSCQRGVVSGCYNLAVDSFNAGDRLASLDQFQAACEKGFALACYQVGFLKESDPTAPDLSKAIEFYKKAEALGHGPATQSREAVEKKLKPKKTPGVI